MKPMFSMPITRDVVKRLMLAGALATASLRADTAPAEPMPEVTVTAPSSGETDAMDKTAADKQWFKEYGMISADRKRVEPGVYHLVVRFTNLGKEPVKLRFVDLNFPDWEKPDATDEAIEVPGRGSYAFPQTWVAVRKYKVGQDTYEADEELVAEKNWESRTAQVSELPNGEDVVDRLKMDSRLMLKGTLAMSAEGRPEVLVDYEKDVYLKPQIVVEADLKPAATPVPDTQAANAN